MPFVERDASGLVVGLYAQPQPRRAEEFLEDGHPDVVAFQSGSAGLGGNIVNRLGGNRLGGSGSARRLARSCNYRLEYRHPAHG